MENVVIKVGGMSCQGCVKNINGVLGALAGVASAEVSLKPPKPRWPSIRRWSAGLRCWKPLKTPASTPNKQQKTLYPREQPCRNKLSA